MKTNILLFLVIFCFSVTSCKGEENIDSEKDGIKTEEVKSVSDRNDLILLGKNISFEMNEEEFSKLYTEFINEGNDENGYATFTYKTNKDNSFDNYWFTVKFKNNQIHEIELNGWQTDEYIEILNSVKKQFNFIKQIVSEDEDIGAVTEYYEKDDLKAKFYDFETAVMIIERSNLNKSDDISQYSVVVVPHEKFAGRGNVEVHSKETGEVVFKIEDQFEDPEEYSKIEYIDLDKNGKDETICYGSTGGNGSFINILVFDFDKSIKPVFSIWSVADIMNLNSNDIFIDNGSYTNIIVQQTVGIGAAKRLFYYPLRYSNGILSIDYEGDEFKNIAVNNSDRLLDAIKSMSVDCSIERSKYPFEAFYIQNMFIKNEEYALSILNEFYPCNDKNVILSEVERVKREITGSKIYEFKN